MLCGVGFFSILFPTVYKTFDGAVQKCLIQLQKLRLIPFFLEPFTLAQLLFWSPLLLRLSATLGFILKMTISNVVWSIFSGLTS